MKHFRWFFLAVLFLPLAVQAQAITVIPRDATVTGNVIRVGQRVDLDGTVTGDAYLVGTDVTVAGQVGGDVIVAARRLVVTGAVAGNIRGVAGEVVLSSAVGRNVTIAAFDVQQKSESVVKGSLAAIAQAVEQHGTVEGSFDVVADTVVIAGTVVGGGQIRNELGLPDEVVGTTTVRAGATVGGTLEHFGSQPVTLEEGATVGAVTERVVSVSTERSLASWRVVWKIVNGFSLLLLGLIGLWLFRRQTQNVAIVMVASPLPSVLFGVIVVFGGPFVAAVVATTVIGIPLALLLIGLYLAALYLAQLMVAIVLGAWLMQAASKRKLKFPESPIMPLVAGVLTLVVVLEFGLRWPYDNWAAYLNILGNVIGLLILFWGVGGFTLAAWRALRSNRGKTNGV